MIVSEKFSANQKTYGVYSAKAYSCDIQNFSCICMHIYRHEDRRGWGEAVGTRKGTLIFLLKFLSFLFFMYLWIFSFLSSTVSLPTLLKVGSSRISDARGVELAATGPSCWLSLVSTCWKNHKQDIYSSSINFSCFLIISAIVQSFL